MVVIRALAVVRVPLLVARAARRSQTALPLGYKTRQYCSACSPAASASSQMEEQFHAFRAELEASNSVREQLRSTVADLDGAIRLVHAALLPVYHSNDNIEKAKQCLPDFRNAYVKLREIIKGRPDEYYKYHDYWRTQMQSVVSSLAFMHWLETGNLLSHKDTEALLELDQGFFLDLDDYLIGLCHMSSDMPRYVVNQVIAGNYGCPQKVSQFLSDLYAAFRLLNLRNDNLRKRFDGIKYDVKKVEEILYDVKIRGLLNAV